MSTAIVWFRRDLRLRDNPAWDDATRRFETVVPVFVADPGLWDVCSPARVGLLAAHLRSLDRSLAGLGGRLLVRRGHPVQVIEELTGGLEAEEVVFNADVSPYARHRDQAVAKRVATRAHWGTLVHPPGSILTGTGDRYRVFTPFWKRWFDLRLPDTSGPGDATVATEWGDGIPDAPDTPIDAGEEAAWNRLEHFDGSVDGYLDDRDRPDLDRTSRLSIDLKYGTISPVAAARHVGAAGDGRQAFVRQLAWRDFYAHLMDELPNTVDEPLRPEYTEIPWRDDPVGFAAWASGATGYPIVDAGMRQLRAEGWIHNRVRMIVASFLVKDLLIDWRRGERYFRRHLLDADVSQNVGNWQWVAGTGADAAPYFRIFNPVTQSKKIDPDGVYIRRWIPELRPLEVAHLHAPWEAPPLELADRGVTIGDTYPAPIVDHARARERTLAAYRRSR